jgi:hypothetical protein
MEGAAQLYLYMKMKKKRLYLLAFWGLVCLFLVFGTTGNPQSISAEQSAGIAIQSEIGIEGNVKEGRWARLRLTITNQSARELKGELQFSMVLPNDSTTQTFAVATALPPGSPKLVEMAVPGTHYYQENNRLQFVDDSGKIVPITLGKPYVEAYTVSDTLVGVVARDPDTLNFLPLLNQQGYRIKMVPIPEDRLPEQMVLLDGIDILVLNDVATGTWSKERLAAIRGWIQQGGTLIVAGGAAYAKTAEGFGELVPVSAEGTVQLSSFERLEEWGGGKALDAQVPVTVSSGKLQAGKVTFAEADTIISAERSYGYGQVIYVAFDPALEPFSSWTGNSLLWTRLLSQTLSQQSNQINYLSPGVGIKYWELDNAIKQFPSIGKPSFGALLVFFVIYVIVVAPLLFLILRAFDRREWAWWIIPVLSIVCSIVIFNVGASDKNQTLTHSLRTIELSGTGGAIRSASIGVFVPKGGTVTAAFEPGVTVSPNADRTGNTYGVLSTDITQRAKRTETKSEAIWKEVPYWSLRTASVQYEASSGHGQFRVEMKPSGQGSIALEVGNETGVELRNVAVLHAGRVYPLGDLASGASASVQVPFWQQTNVVGWFDYGNQLFPYNYGNSDANSRERGMLNAYSNNKTGTWRKPIIVGFSEDQTAWFEVNGQEARSDNLTMWVQPFEWIDVQQSGVILPGSITPYITKQDMPSIGYEHPTNRMILAPGSLEFEYPLPGFGDGEEEAATYDSLTIYQEVVDGGLLQLAIWNEKLQQWESLNANVASVRPNDEVAAYLTQTNTIRMKLTVSDQVFYNLPAIGLERGTSE